MASLINPAVPAAPLFARSGSTENTPLDSVVRAGFIAPSVVSATLPESVSYAGTHLVNLGIQDADWKTSPPGGGGGGRDKFLLSRLASATHIEGRLGATPISAEEVRERLNRGHSASVYFDIGGTPVVSFSPVVVNPGDETPAGTAGLPPDEPATQPASRRMMLVEEYRLTTFLGQYGKGRVLKTLSLLPGERARLTMFTYRHTEQTTREASTIFDSFSTAQETELTTQIQAESSNQSAYERTTGTSARASASIWRISASAETSLNTRLSRESLYRTVSDVTSRQVNQASARRDVTIDTSLETRVAFGEEVGSVREIENVNLSKTLNFVFRQMNQEVLTLLHLVDVRVAYENGSSYEESPLENLDTFLAKYLKDAATVTTVKGKIEEALTGVHTYKWRDSPAAANTESVFEKIDVRSGPGGATTNVMLFRDMVSEYTHTYTAADLDQGSGLQTMKLQVPGLLAGVERHVLRTDAVLVQGFVLENESTLDKYEMQKQQEDIRTRQALNTILEAASGRIAAGDAATIQPVLEAVANIASTL